MTAFLRTVLLCLVLPFSAFASPGSVKGAILSADGQPVPGVTVLLDGTDFVTETDTKGNYVLEHIPEGSYSLSVSGVGFTAVHRAITVSGGDPKPEDFSIRMEGVALKNVTVLGLTELQAVNRQAYNVTTIDAKKLYNTTLDLSHALDRLAGIRVRESGGVGSNIDFSLNGFSGNQVRFFLDGVPMDNFGSSFQINNVPVNFAERVEVYKGSVPVWLGSDALGGAVNIITGNKLRNYIDVSYSFGSFNTHRSCINAALTSKKGFTAQISAFQNYSDNNYKVTLDVADINTGAYTRDQTVRRFHDRYHNETVVANIGVLDKSWADQLLLGITLGNNYKEIQTGARMVEVFGARHTRGNIIMPTLKYKKQNFLISGLDVVLNANYNFGKEQTIDTVSGRYDWYGNYKAYPGLGGESARTMYKFGNNNGLVTTTLFYKISEKQSLALNNVFSTFNRKGADELYPESTVNAQPQTTIKNISGLSYKIDFTDKWTATVFGKILHQNAHRRSVITAVGMPDEILDQYNKSTNYGYGLATSYYLLPQLQAKFSYEKSNRLPENFELFGDVVNQESNFNLKPEISHNFNLGLNYNFSIGEQHRFMAGLTGIYRDAKDFIYFRFNANQWKVVADNLNAVSNLGFESELRYSFKQLLMVELNATYQDIRNQVKYDPPGSTGISPVYHDRMPNIPFLYGHGSASVFFNDVLRRGDKLSFGYNLLYVYAFYLYWPSRGSKDDKYDIPTQLSHDVNMIYTLKNGRYNIALECRNLANERLYDNFSLQKPGRSFAIKLRYFYAK